MAGTGPKDQSGKRQPRAFEPPPWEQAQFDELERKRAEQRIDDLVGQLKSAPKAPPEAEDDHHSEESTPTEAPDDLKIITAGQMTPAAGGPRTVELGDLGASVTVDSASGRIDDSAMATMLIGLKAEEPDAIGNTWRVGFGIGIGLGTMGLMLTLWALTVLAGAIRLAAKVNAGPAAVMGPTIVLLMGAMMTALGTWLTIRSYRQRGV